ncbi:MAG: hypothetical protein K2I77_03785 [Anaeroplasmataceae bacterium]|nr:hypothetical protein [Anaeroplasmataceae bacterium]
MKIICNFIDPNYPLELRCLGYTYEIIVEEKKFYYIFEVNQSEAVVKTDNEEYLEIVVDAFHQRHKPISTYYTLDRHFYKSYDEVQTFLLPISILQVSKPFLDESIIDELKEIEITNYHFPVTIVQDEYVLLKGHHILKACQEAGTKMVSVYLDEVTPLLLDRLYLLKEQNVKYINEIPLLKSEEYEQVWSGLKEMFKTYMN